VGSTGNLHFFAQNPTLHWLGQILADALHLSLNARAGVAIFENNRIVFT